MLDGSEIRYRQGEHYVKRVMEKTVANVKVQRGQCRQGTDDRERRRQKIQLMLDFARSGGTKK